MILPIDSNSNPIPLSQPTVALGVLVDDTISSATDWTLPTGTTEINVTAINAGIYMRYAATAASNAFDEYIVANSTSTFIKPESCTVVSFIQDASTGTALLRARAK